MMSTLFTLLLLLLFMMMTMMRRIRVVGEEVGGVCVDFSGSGQVENSQGNDSGDSQMHVVLKRVEDR